MNAPTLLIALALAACGGKTTAPDTTSDADPSSRPAPGTGACEMPSRALNGLPEPTCTLCSDDQWHCSGQDAGVAPCAAGANPCTSTSTTCVSCGGTDGVLCNAMSDPGGDNHVVIGTTPVTCSP